MSVGAIVDSSQQSPDTSLCREGNPVPVMCGDRERVNWQTIFPRRSNRVFAVCIDQLLKNPDQNRDRKSPQNARCVHLMSGDRALGESSLSSVDGVLSTSWEHGRTINLDGQTDKQISRWSESMHMFTYSRISFVCH